MLKSKPQINGNSIADFHQAYAALRTALEAVELAAGIMRSEITNGRNYQHLGSHGVDASIADRRWVNDQIMDAKAAIGRVTSAVVDAVKEV